MRAIAGALRTRGALLAAGAILIAFVFAGAFLWSRQARRSVEAQAQTRALRAKSRALECMTQAIYYEAATEPLEGKQAVAQVILNRVHHPAFPASVCGVVFQGADRATGCQFTFACDGSLRRTPAESLWSQARKVAAQALAGKVFGPVGHATHYHADYVLPYWADSLDKEIQIGRHIFYRLKGDLGATHTFSQGYKGHEAPALTPTDVQVAASAIEGAAGSSTGELLGTVSVAPAEPPKSPPILADLDHGQLRLDEGRTMPAPLRGGPPSSPVTQGCGLGSPAEKTKAAPLDNRLGQPKPLDCR
ncbi:MAG: cell wall hydrolase [Sphingomonadales bacterium]|nr:cell wall hydrolase [Sphingomonadales bacterium]